MTVDTPLSAAAWSAVLSQELGRPVRVTFGRARVNVLVARHDGDRVELRMNAAFASAPEDVQRAVTAWLRSGKRARRACARLDEWIAEMAERLSPQRTGRTRRARPVLRGQHHDLGPLTEGLLERELPPPLLPEERRPIVTWGRRARRRVRHTLQLGCFDPEARVVRIHPVLDQVFVPGFFVTYVLFHELLHAALDTDRAPGGRHRHHGPEFRRREQAYRDYARAQRWQERHLPALIRSVRTGRAVPPAKPVEAPSSAWVQGLLFR